MPNSAPFRRRFDPAAALTLAGLLAASCTSTTVETFPEQDAIGPAAAAAAPPPALPVANAPATPLVLGMQEAILTALEHNPALAVQRLTPQIQRTSEEVARAAFDPILSAESWRSRSRTDWLSQNGQEPHRDSWGAATGVRQFLPTGTSLDARLDYARQWSADPSLHADPAPHAAGAGLTISQALLQGFGSEVNLVQLRQAGLATLASQYELRGFAEALVADVERTYWDVMLAEKRIEIVQNSLDIAQRQLTEILESIQVGRLAVTEKAAAEAEVASRRVELIQAESSLDKLRLRLLNLLSPPNSAVPGGAGIFDRPVTLTAKPVIPPLLLEAPAVHVNRALTHRPDLNQARLQLQQRDLELVRTRNGLLPKLDLFINLRQSGYANSFGNAWEEVDGDDYAVTGGARLEFPVINREARALHTRSQLNIEQAKGAIANLTQLAEVDVRAALLEIKRAQAQVTATAATARAQNESLRVEQERFKVGKSTSLLVSQAQRDALLGNLAAAQAVADCLKAMVNLYQTEGVLLELRGLQAPGSVPVPAAPAAPR